MKSATNSETPPVISLHAPVSQIPPPPPSTSALESDSGTGPTSSRAKKRSRFVLLLLAGCVGLGVVGVIGFLAIIGLVVSAPESGDAAAGTPDAAQDKLVKALKPLGPTNAVAQRIASLNRRNAYSMGEYDGAKAAKEYAEKTRALDRNDDNSALEEFPATFESLLDLMNIQNQFDPVVFSEYKRGWNSGAHAVVNAAARR